MASRIISSQQLADRSTRSKADARALVLQSLAGRARMAAELIMGRSIVAGEDAAIPRNPSGDLGVNMSGPPWGSAWRSPHVGSGGIKPDTGNFIGQRLLGEVVAGEPLVIPLRHFIQPFELASLAPWSRLRPILRAYCASGGPISLTLTTSQEIEGQGGISRTIVSAISGTSEQTVNSSSLYWDVRPRSNRLLLTITSPSATAVRICGLSLDNVVKRSH